MTNTLPSQRRTRRVIPAVVIVLGMLLISAVVIQQVAAQTDGGLKPPFKLIRPASLPAPLSGVPPLPLNAPIVMSETFDSSFIVNVRYNFDVSNTSVPWHLVNANGGIDSSYTWGRVAGAPLPDTLWNAATNSLGAPQIIAGQPYTKNMQSYAVYGPIDLTDYTSAFISMTYALDTLDGDLFGAAYSTDGTNFTWLAATSGRDPSLSIKHTNYYPIPASVLRQNQVWIAIVFTSQDRDNIDALGVYVEEIALRAVPAYKIYMPLMQLDSTPTPTPTATSTPGSNFLYNYTFGSGLNTDSQFLTWGGQMEYSCGTDCTVIQNVSTNGNPGGAVNFSMGGLQTIAGTSPNHTIPSNFDLTADLMLVEGKADARFGLIFGASSSTFYVDGDGFTKMDASRNYYKFDLNIDPNDETSIKLYRLQRYDNGSATNLQGGTDFPAGVAHGLGQWNTVRIKRQGSNIQISVNGYLAINLNDSTFTGDRKFGIDLHARDLNNNSNPLKIRFDNVKVQQLP